MYYFVESLKEGHILKKHMPIFTFRLTPSSGGFGIKDDDFHTVPFSRYTVMVYRIFDYIFFPIVQS